MEIARRKATLKSIAAAAGVHPSTVSRALMGAEGSRIPEATVARIRKAAAELEYEPNPWAQSLRTQRTMMIGLAIPRLTDLALAQMFEAAQWRARELGYQTLTVSAETEDVERKAIRTLVDRRTDGLILATATLRDPLLPEIQAAGLPFVLLNRKSRGYPWVSADDVLGGYLATRHLIDVGHKVIGHLSGPTNVSTGRLRLDGYRKALKEAGLDAPRQLVVQGAFDAESSLAAARRLLDLRPRPTAIFAVNDIGAIATMAVARSRGLRVPEDLAVIGYNDSEISSLLPIPVSTVRVPLLDMGRVAVDLLIGLLAGQDVEPVMMVPELVRRESSGAERDNRAAPARRVLPDTEDAEDPRVGRRNKRNDESQDQ